MRLLRLAGGQREHGVFVVGVEQRLAVARVEQDKVLLEELAHNVGAGHVAQERRFGRRQIGVVGHVERDLGRKVLAILSTHRSIE